VKAALQDVCVYVAREWLSFFQVRFVHVLNRWPLHGLRTCTHQQCTGGKRVFRSRPVLRTGMKVHTTDPTVDQEAGGGE
jgi:hypothetical protein